MFNYYISLGSNLGDREEYLKKAQFELNAHFIQIIQASSIYETEAWGQEEEDPLYLNQVLYVNCPFPPDKFLGIIQQIEYKNERVREKKWAARTLDIDILYCSQSIINTKNLTVPHPHIQNRRFILTPLTEIAPNFKHPLLQKSHKELLLLCDDPLNVQKI